MITIQVVALLLVLMYILYIYQKNKNEKKAYRSAQEELLHARQRLSEASEDFNYIEKEIFQLINEQFEEPYAEYISNGIVDIGMPTTFLTMAWGHPQRIEKIDAPTGDENWYYKEHKLSGASTQVVVENQRVIKLKDC
ncbi:hypothetical protein U0035_07825 [Niabella yanshanensis]|uniref:Uncharacterized protein n=1 Tax=Niabella yanshanensis TaxID=577386 RepID=A0ABZ0WA75_9BACT|nr:hypothetical protein [Niabella yanshanensis]WQD40051.1 hypothetical protein U0035_07825 [Niabella yanshanensis]